MKRSFVAALALLLPLYLSAQEFRGTITGSITDASGAQIAGGNVTVTEVNTNTRTQTVSDASGHYTAPFLLPGDYDINSTAPGFKEAIRKGVHVGAGDHAVIDFKLDVGDAAQSIEVTADVPLINSENASVGQAITSKEVEDLPLNGGTPLAFAALSMGVIATGQPGLIHPFDAGAAAGWSIGGTASQTNEILVNGSPDATWDGRLAYSPPRDAVSEVRVKAFDADAAYGHTGGGTLNQVLKSGTNQLHGTLAEANQPNNLTANNFFNNKAGLGNPVTHYNQYGATVGGPLFIPKVYNGKDKLFWFFAWEGLKDSQPNTTFVSVPTDKEKQGDFSDLLKNGGSSYQLYSPYSGVLNGTVITRSPYAGNVIPVSQISPIGTALLKYYPSPNLAGTNVGFSNFGNNSPTTDDYNNELGRVDYNMSNNNRLFADIRHTSYSQVKNNYFNNIATGSDLTRSNIGSSLDDVYTINATNVLDMHFNFTRLAEAHPSPSQGFNPTTLGFPSYLAANSAYLQLPYETFATNSGFQALGLNGANQLPSQSLQLYATWSRMQGSHTLKFGVDARQYNLNYLSYGNSVGNFAFTANTWVRSASNASSTVALGQDMAELLLGLPTGGQYDLNTSGAYYQHYLAGFVQDDWRVKNNLTVTLGIRYDHDGPWNEKYGRTVDGFDTTTPNPLSAAATAAYAKSPIPQLPPSAFKVLGGLTYPSSGQTAIFDTTSHLFSPRVGLAWTPERLHNKTVIRAGFGMFVSPISMASLSVAGTYSTNPIVAQEGFSQSTTLSPSPDNYLTPALAATLANPFPAGFKAPPGSSQGLGTFAGQTVNYLNSQFSNPYSARWNVGLEQQLTTNTMIEVSYIGNHGVHLPVTVTQLNGIPAQYLSTSPVRDQPLITSLTGSTPNPFAGLATNQNTATTTPAQLLSHFPQFPVGSGSGSTGVLLQDSNVGSSYFQSFNVRLQKRFSTGVTIIGNYIRSKMIERVTWLNDTDPLPEKRISPFDHPNRFVTAVSYDLPVGKGRALNISNRWLNMLVGGWKVNGTYTYQTGAPITWVNGSTTSPGDYVYFGAPIVLDNRQTNSTAFNIGAFDTKSADAFQYHIRTFSTTFGNLRMDGINQLDASILKQFHLGRESSKSYFQFRVEGYNIVNHATFSAPSTTANNSQFGDITAQANRPRALTLAARIVF
jgi:hypothetical protein